jgi:hypothetical protein
MVDSLIQELLEAGAWGLEGPLAEPVTELITTEMVVAAVVAETWSLAAAVGVVVPEVALGAAVEGDQEEPRQKAGSEMVALVLLPTIARDSFPALATARSEELAARPRAAQ